MKKSNEPSLFLIPIYLKKDGSFYPDFWSKISDQQNRRTLKELEKYGLDRKKVETILLQTFHHTVVLREMIHKPGRAMTVDPRLAEQEEMGKKISRQYENAIESLKRLHSFTAIFPSVKRDIDYLIGKKQGLAFIYGLNPESWAKWELKPKSISQMFKFQSRLVFEYMKKKISASPLWRGHDFAETSLHRLLSEMFLQIYPSYFPGGIDAEKMRTLSAIHKLRGKKEKTLKKLIQGF